MAAGGHWAGSIPWEIGFRHMKTRLEGKLAGIVFFLENTLVFQGKYPGQNIWCGFHVLPWFSGKLQNLGSQSCFRPN